MKKMQQLGMYDLGIIFCSNAYKEFKMNPYMSWCAKHSSNNENEAFI